VGSLPGEIDIGMSGGVTPAAAAIVRQ
jgi:hypothetical protein